MEQDGPLHLPDFSEPDFTQPALERVDLAEPGFVMPDPARGPYGDWPLPVGLDRPATGQPEPASPDLLAPEKPDALSYPAENAPALSRPEYAPEVVMSQRPAEPDPAARAIVLASPDEAALPADLAYPELYTNDDEMTWRKRHFALLKTGLAQGARDYHAG